MNLKHLVLFGTSLGAIADACAYATSTHVAMTQHAVARSRLATDPVLLENLGLADLLAVDKDAPFKASSGTPHQYVAIGPKRLMAGDYHTEEAVMSSVHSDANYSIAGWVMRGAMREDDNLSETSDTDEPGGAFQRVFAHFYDPHFDRGLTMFGLAVGARSPDWALRSGTVSRATTSGGERTNIYNMEQATEAVWRALTGVTGSGEALPDLQALPGSATMSKATVRKAYWAAAFRMLGNGVHLLQDTAQPQHTRNDAHAGLGCAFGSCAAGHDSFYEKYVGARTVGAVKFVLEEGILSTSEGPTRALAKTPLVFDGYAVSRPFAKLADYFSTGTGEAGNASGIGLANYSNRGFYTAGTNVGNSNYPSPDPSGLGLAARDITDPTDMAGNPVPGKVVVYEGPVRDTLTGGAEPARLTTLGAWNEFLAGTTFASYSLNHYNYQDQVNKLLPRGVAYTAAFIDHFLRGQLEISPPDEGVYAVLDHGQGTGNAENGGFYRLKLKVKNVTMDGGAKINTGSTGILRAVARFHRNKCYKPDLSGEYGAPGIDWTACRSEEQEIVTSEALFAPSTINSEAASVTFEFTEPIPIAATDLKIQVVYRGQLGDDQLALAVGSKDISEPTYHYRFAYWDQFLYSSPWPALSIQSGTTSSGPATKSYEWWCGGAFASLADCNITNGLITKLRFYTEKKPTPGYDPANTAMQQNTSYILDEMPPLDAHVTMRAPVGSMARIAILADLVEPIYATVVDIHRSLQYQTNPDADYRDRGKWYQGKVIPQVTQMDPTSRQMSTFPRYMSARGVFVPELERGSIDIGEASPMPNLIVNPGDLNF